MQILRLALLLQGAAWSLSISGNGDPHKPRFHFLPKSNWMNDPNGPFFDARTGLFHLFFQYQTPRTWGHAVTKNLADWTVLPVALNYTTAWYTDVAGHTAGVYSGSATIVPNTSSVWLSASTPTNNMVLLASPSDPSDPLMQNWTWDSENPVILSNSSSNQSYVGVVPPPGRDPTSMWPCGNGDKLCIAYATQQSQGCPCSGISGIAVFSATYHKGAADSIVTWGEWSFEGYLLQDTEEAVMWECPDFFALPDVNNKDAFGSMKEDVGTTSPNNSVWLTKFSIGPGPSFAKPLGRPGPRDYYVTGTYNASSTRALDAFKADPVLFKAAMDRDAKVVLDSGAFYASKTFDYLGQRILFGWLPEERLVADNAAPWGWAGAQSLPRQVIPYQYNGSWYVRTPPVQTVVETLRNCTGADKSCDSKVSYPSFTLNVSAEESQTGRTSRVRRLNFSVGDQLELIANLQFPTSANHVGLKCGLRVRSTLLPDSGRPSLATEYTDVGVEVVDGGDVRIYVDPANSCSSFLSAVNRTVVSSASIDVDAAQNGTVQLRLLLDHSVLEAFLADGRRSITRRVYPANAMTAVQTYAFADCASAAAANQSGCSCQFHDITTYQLRDALFNYTNPSPSSGPVDFPTWGIAAVTVAAGLVLGALVGLIVWFRRKPPRVNAAHRPLTVTDGDEDAIGGRFELLDNDEEA